MTMISKPLNRIYSDFENFAWSNNILASTAGFTIGMATKDLIENVAHHAGVPTIEKLYTIITKKTLPSISSGIQHTFSDSSILISLDILQWLGILLMTFIIGTYILQWIVHKASASTVNVNVHVHEKPENHRQ